MAFELADVTGYLNWFCWVSMNFTWLQTGGTSKKFLLNWRTESQTRAGNKRWINFYIHCGHMSPIAENRSPSSTSMRPKPLRRYRQHVKLAEKFFEKWGLLGQRKLNKDGA